MKYFATLLSFLVASSSLVSSRGLQRRQDISGAPSCGQTCLITAATTSGLTGSCSFTDMPCLCKQQELQDTVEKCVLAGCATADQIKMLQWSEKTCPGLKVAIPSSATAAATGQTSGSEIQQTPKPTKASKKKHSSGSTYKSAGSEKATTSTYEKPSNYKSAESSNQYSAGSGNYNSASGNTASTSTTTSSTSKGLGAGDALLGILTPLIPSLYKLVKTLNFNGQN